jgi:hypothetical protein
MTATARSVDNGVSAKGDGTKQELAETFELRVWDGVGVRSGLHWQGFKLNLKSWDASLLLIVATSAEQLTAALRSRSRPDVQ